MSGLQHLYVPALRMKAGELQGIRDLEPDVSDATLPRMIVPPLGDRDNILQPRLFEEKALPEIGGALRSHWFDRSILIEPTYLMDELGRDKIGKWLPKMFERARAAQTRPIPLIQISDLLQTDAAAFDQAIDRAANIQFGLVVQSGDAEDRKALDRAVRAIDRMRLTPEQCVILVDFQHADLSDPTIVAPIIEGALENVRQVATWQQVVFQGTNFPEANPAQPDSHELIPRSEWIAWKQAVAFDPETADYLLFGDYAADNAKLVFSKRGGVPIPHYRYTAPDAWYVRRGSSTGKTDAIMRKVCLDIVNSNYFAGRDFSSADDYIYLTAHAGGGPGSPTIWRAVNTTHHITHVVKEVGRIRGRAFLKRALDVVPTQRELF